MGGGHHDHHEPPYKVPDYRVYKVDNNTPELQKVQRCLAAQGLKDPWLRNEVWRYHRDLVGARDWNNTWGRFVFRKFHYGLGLAVLAVGLETAYDSLFGSDQHGHGHH